MNPNENRSWPGKHVNMSSSYSRGACAGGVVALESLGSVIKANAGDSIAMLAYAMQFGGPKVFSTKTKAFQAIRSITDASFAYR